MMHVTLDWSYLIASSDFSNVYFVVLHLIVIKWFPFNHTRVIMNTVMSVVHFNIIIFFTYKVYLSELTHYCNSCIYIYISCLSVISTLSALHHAIKDCQRYEKEPELHFGLSSKYDLISHALL
jgi:hypothetical protein